MARAKARQTGRRSRRATGQPANDPARELQDASTPDDDPTSPSDAQPPAAEASSTARPASTPKARVAKKTGKPAEETPDPAAEEAATPTTASVSDSDTSDEATDPTEETPATSDDQPSDDQASDDDAVDGSVTDASDHPASDEEAADGGAASADAVADGDPASADEVAEDTAAEDEDETVDDGASSADTTAEGERAQDGEAQDDDARDDGAQDGDARDGDGEPEAGGGGTVSPPLPTDPQAVALITALMRLREALAGSHLPLDVAGADEARQRRRAMLDQLDDYILPRLVQLEAPLLAVVGGSTGAGKSTLVNTLVGSLVSEPGVLRPTTRSPVLVHHPGDTDWFNGERILPGLMRSTSDDKPGGTDDPGSLRLIASDTIPQGLAILDAPDIDSVVESNRELAAQLLAAADLWLFVTTASRYADAVPWDFLRDAADRSTAVAIVLDRVPPGSEDDVTGHLAHMLLERGLGDSPMFAVPEAQLDQQGLLPDEAIGQIRTWLTALAADATARAAVVRRTLRGAVNSMTKKLPAFAGAVRSQSDMVADLRKDAEAAYERAVRDIEEATQDGTMLRGEVLARWQEFVGTGELLRGLQTRVGRVRDRLKSSVSGRPQTTRELNEAVESGLEALLREHAEAAAERAEAAWQASAPGRQLLASGERDLGRASRTFTADAARAVRDWQGQVLDLVRREGADKRSTARILSYGVNGLGIALMIVVFASTAGIPTGAEVGVGAGTAVLGQKLLEAVFGDQAVRNLAAKARKDLNIRVRALMDAELARYVTLLDEHAVDPAAAKRVTESARAVEDCL
jgi:energy-coupling factor transporter ATP-binding protein EcfA2